MKPQLHRRAGLSGTHASAFENVKVTWGFDLRHKAELHRFQVQTSNDVKVGRSQRDTLVFVLDVKRGQNGKPDVTLPNLLFV